MQKRDLNFLYNTGKLKGVLVVLTLIAALAAFDQLGDNYNAITGAVVTANCGPGTATLCPIAPSATTSGGSLSRHDLCSQQYEAGQIDAQINYCCQQDITDHDACDKAYKASLGLTLPEKQFSSKEANEVYNGLREALESGTVSMADYGRGNAKDPSKFLNNLYDKVYENYFVDDVARLTACNALAPTYRYCVDHSSYGDSYIVNCEQKRAQIDKEKSDVMACINDDVAKTEKIINEMKTAMDSAAKELKKISEAAQQAANDAAAKKAAAEQAKQQAAAEAEAAAKQKATATQTQRAGSGGGGTAGTDTTALSGKFSEARKQAIRAAEKTVADVDNKEVSPAQIEKGLSETLPYIKTEKTFPSIKEGQTLSFELTGSWFREGLLTAKKDINAGSISVAAVNGPSIPKLLRGTNAELDPKIGNSLPKNYEVQEEYKISAAEEGKAQQAQADLFREALLKWEAPKGPPGTTRKYEMFHYTDNSKWEKLPTTLDFCGSTTCTYISDPEGTGYYAIVLEKPAKRLGEWHFIAAAFLGILAGLALVILNYRKAANAK